MTEEQYQSLLSRFENLVNETLYLEGKSKPRQNNLGITKAKDKIQKYMQKSAASGQRFHDVASKLGLNSTGYEKGPEKYAKMYNDGFEKELNKNLKQTYGGSNTLTVTVNPGVNDEILRAAEKIRKYVRQNPQGGVIDKEAFAKDPEYKYLMGMKDLMDLRGISYLYDDNSPMPSRPDEYGLKGENPQFDFTHVPQNIGAKNGYSGDIMKYWLSKLRSFTTAKYGLDVYIPDDIFPSGNNKLPSTTLVINFNSAIRCPAWNECLVKYACYARSGEKKSGYNSSFRSNTNKNLLWELTNGDSEMLHLMMNLVKSYLFNYESIFNQAKDLLYQYKIKNIESLLNIDFDDELISGELFDIFKNNQMATAVRLNEDGDFLGQWLVDAWDEFGGKVRKFGIVISAYTCRNLNYEGVKNIVLNSSNIANKNVDRYFIALSEEAYNAFDDTHEGFDPETGKLKVVLKPLGFFEGGKWVPNGKYYYKCPCNIEEIMGPKKEKTSPEDYDCYKCETCYTPNTLNNGEPYFVFVKVHGEANIKNLKERNNGNFQFGFSEHYMENMQKTKGYQQINENIQDETDGDTSDIAINQVTRNAVLSMNRRFMSFGNALQEEREKVEEEFKKTLDRINNVEF